jgi:hypothetical protein
MRNLKVTQFSFLLTILALCTGCAELMDSNYGSNNPYGYNQPYPQNYGGYGNGYQAPPPGYNSYDNNYQQQIRNQEAALAEERRRLQREREQLEAQQRHPAPPPPQTYRRESCPGGFRPSEQKCSPQERRKGCQDMRLPGGLGCVRR